MLALVALGWNAGELHRQNCQRDGRTGCSVLPWDSGQPKRNQYSKFFKDPTPTADCILYGTGCP